MFTGGGPLLPDEPVPSDCCAVSRRRVDGRWVNLVGYRRFDAGDARVAARGGRPLPPPRVEFLHA
jgi:hypothetical protein